MDREIPWALPANASPEMRFHRLVVVQRAIWSLLKEHAGLNDADLFARIGELDATDGNVDGRYTPRARCDACGAVSAAGARCTFCNATVGEPDPFSGL